MGICHISVVACLTNGLSWGSLTREMLVENAQRSPSKARYKMVRTADAFLFRFK